MRSNRRVHRAQPAPQPPPNPPCDVNDRERSGPHGSEKAVAEQEELDAPGLRPATTACLGLRGGGGGRRRRRPAPNLDGGFPPG